MATIERIGSFQRFNSGDDIWWRCEIAVDGRRLAPLWLCAPEFQEMEAAGEDAFWFQLARKAVMADTEARDLAPRLIPTKKEESEHVRADSYEARQAQAQALRFIPPKGGWPAFAKNSPKDVPASSGI